MSNLNKEIDSWLEPPSSENESVPSDGVWEPGFDVDRQVIHSRFGPYRKMFLRPSNYVKRFFHTIYPLPIDEWHCIDRISLYGGFCIIDIILDIRFQATFKYAFNHREVLSELNEHIKNSYYNLAIDLVNRDLLQLTDGAWVQDGLTDIEKQICFSINEMLILHNIQSEVVCKLTPNFEEFPDVKVARENIYFSVLRKNFEFNKLERELLFDQRKVEKKQKIEYKRTQLQQINEMSKLDRQEQSLLANNEKRLLEDQAHQELERFEVKKKIHLEEAKQKSELNEIALAVELEGKNAQQKLLMEQELQDKEDFLIHQAKLKEKELQADIVDYEREQASWRTIKDKIHSEELDLKHKQKQLEFETDVGYKKRYEVQRLALQEESFSARKKSDIYLKREIELLELEKQRLALHATIKEYKKKGGKEH